MTSHIVLYSLGGNLYSDGEMAVSNGYRYVMPRGGAFSFSHPFGVAGDPDAFERAVVALVRAYEDEGFPGRLEVEREGTMLHVVPAEMRDKTGATVTVKPIMNALIVFPTCE